MKAQVNKIRLKKGDTVMVRSGKYRGHSGKVVAVHPKTNRVTVEGINQATRHRKPTAANPRPSAEKILQPLPISKVGGYDFVAKKASRIGYNLQKNGKIRVLKTSGREMK